MTIMHCGLWHRVEVNKSGIERTNIFVAYCPSWITEADRSARIRSGSKR